MVAHAFLEISIQLWLADTRTVPASPPQIEEMKAWYALVVNMIALPHKNQILFRGILK